MRIAMIIADPGIPPDGSKGASVHLRALARTLLSRGHQLKPGFVRSPNAPFPVDGMELATLLRAYDQNELPRPDVVYERYSLGHLGGLALARRLGVPLVLEVNSPLVDEERRFRGGALDPALERIERTLWHDADAVIAVSHPMAAMIDRYRNPERPAVVIPNGCFPEDHPEPQPTNPPRLAFLGTPRRWHGVELLAPILAKLRADGRDVTLEILGGRGESEFILAEAARYGVAESMLVSGPLAREELIRRLTGMTATIAPYPEHDPFYFCPLKVVESQAAGVPVITTAVGDLPLLVGDAGIVLPPANASVEGFAAAISRLLDDRDAWTTMSRAGRRRAVHDLSWERAAIRMEHVFLDATSEMRS